MAPHLTFGTIIHAAGHSNLHNVQGNMLADWKCIDGRLNEVVDGCRDAHRALLTALGSTGQSTAHLELHPPLRAQMPPTRAPLASLQETNDSNAGLSQPLESLPATQDCATQPQAHTAAEAVLQVTVRLC